MFNQFFGKVFPRGRGQSRPLNDDEKQPRKISLWRLFFQTTKPNGETYALLVALFSHLLKFPFPTDITRYADTWENPDTQIPWLIPESSEHVA